MSKGNPERRDNQKTPTKTNINFDDLVKNIADTTMSEAFVKANERTQEINPTTMAEAFVKAYERTQEINPSSEISQEIIPTQPKPKEEQVEEQINSIIPERKVVPEIVEEEIQPVAAMAGGADRDNSEAENIENRKFEIGEEYVVTLVLGDKGDPIAKEKGDVGLNVLILNRDISAKLGDKVRVKILELRQGRNQKPQGKIGENSEYYMAEFIRKENDSTNAPKGKKGEVQRETEKKKKFLSDNEIDKLIETDPEKAMEEIRRQLI